MVYVMLAEGFEEIEALTVVDVLRRAGIDVSTVSITGSKTVTGSHNIPVTADILLPDADLENADMVVLPGGMPGTNNLYDSSELEKAIAHRVENGKWVAAICAAPIILGRRGHLKGLEAVCYPGFENELIGAKIKNEKVVISSKIITSKGPGTALDFAFAIVSVLKDENTARKLRAGMQAE
ncbi:DJ-1/PfpI family protein [Thermoclostridium stercorarium]|uniref:Thiamine biosynthesis protein ThiJ n=1 Tax=Thermoclostridium stercorarium subsp. leptospartum DSM 9219 TaxID=1346611 RepID=A0A1B1YJ28_THEST|nr:DJ-1 family glyoxalase III [Thermoclostridium stercorarium]ANX00761.1 thiamine biosynthesis protein ThiJ [Thermoclostridium stercorarium subsp. leptospartum DSM 9219]UZQ86375.1 DJ-1/PfpI family protein [Thermoclostridium stercorarium]